MTPFITVFTSTYNRIHTLERLYESLCNQTCDDFEWLIIDDGSSDGTKEKVAIWSEEKKLRLRYIYKNNEGLYTGYNLAYLNAKGCLSMCVDSDDYLPLDSIEKIKSTWLSKGGDSYSGVLGLDCYADNSSPIGGKFPEGLTTCYLSELFTRGIHRGDTKQAMRTDLMQCVAPMIGYANEKNFNPIYLLLQVGDAKPLVVINENLCFVDYQLTDSMSSGIINQYVDSPNSFVKLRLLQMTLKHNALRYRIKTTIHFVAEVMLSKRIRHFSSYPSKLMLFCCLPFGVILWTYIKYASTTGNNFLARWWR